LIDWLVTSGGRHSSGEKEAPAAGGIHRCARHGAVALDDRVDEEAGEQSDVGGRWLVHLLVKRRQHPDDAALDQHADEELESDVAPEHRVDEVVGGLAWTELTQPVANVHRRTRRTDFRSTAGVLQAGPFRGRRHL